MKKAIRRKRPFKLRMVQLDRSYTLDELRRIYGSHVASLRLLVKQGMKVLNPGCRPLLVMGHEMERMIKERRAKRRCTLAPNEFFCPHCKGPRVSEAGRVALQRTGRFFRSGNEMVIVQGQCILCGSPLRRFSSNADIAQWWNNRAAVEKESNRECSDHNPAITHQEEVR